jgi:hypothetical protein
MSHTRPEFGVVLQLQTTLSNILGTPKMARARIARAQANQISAQEATEQVPQE